MYLTLLSLILNRYANFDYLNLIFNRSKVTSFNSIDGGFVIVGEDKQQN